MGLPGRPDSRLVRAVSRAPLGVRAKLLVAFATIAILLVAVAALGLRVIGQSNARIETLGTLQLRAATYQDLQTQAQQLRQLLALRVAADANVDTYLGGSAAGQPGGRRWILIDSAIATALSQFGPATNESRFGFVPPPADEVVLEQIRREYRRFTNTLREITTLDRVGSTSKGKPFLTVATDTNNNLGALTDSLAATTRAEASMLIAESRTSYADSRDLFVAVGGASILLAIFLGFVLSRSLVGPIQLTEARLAEIAEGDFSKHVVVRNRDELGALAVNLNRMNDELRGLYDELETVSRHKSEFLANVSHELRTPLNAIIGFSELLEQQLVGELNEQQLVYVGDVIEAGRHQLALINDILDLSKVEAGKMELDRSDFSLRDTLETGLTMHADGARRADITLALALDPDEIDAVRRREEAAPGRLQPAVECRQVHARRRPCRREGRIARRRRRGLGVGHGTGNRSSRPGADLRGVRAGPRRCRRSDRTGRGWGFRWHAGSPSCREGRSGSKAPSVRARRSGSRSRSSRWGSAGAERARPHRRRQRQEPEVGAGRAAPRRVSNGRGCKWRGGYLARRSSIVLT